MPRPVLDPEQVVHPTAALRELRKTLQEALEGLQEPRKGFGGTSDPRRDIAALSGLLERVEQARLVVMAGAWCADGPVRLTLAEVSAASGVPVGSLHRMLAPGSGPMRRALSRRPSATVPRNPRRPLSLAWEEPVYDVPGELDDGGDQQPAVAG